MAATNVTREYDFYRHLCEELITWAVGAMFAVHMNVRRRQKALEFWQRLDEIADLSLESDNAALFEIKKLTRQVMSFYKGPLRYATAPDHDAGETELASINTLSSSRHVCVCMPKHAI